MGRITDSPILKKGGFRDIMSKALDFDLEVSEFELQLRYYVHYRT